MLDSLAEDAIALVGNKSRAILGIAGSSGVGKSTLVEQLLVRIRAIMGEQWAAHVPMDGFHLADVQLERLGVRDRKGGAPETFDADGYAHLLLSTTAVKADRIIVNDAAGPFVSE
jgi:pantothenate kinase